MIEIYNIILDSSMVEHSAVNRVVVGSSPTRGVKLAVRAVARKSVNINVCGLFSINVKPRKRHNGSHGCKSRMSVLIEK